MANDSSAWFDPPTQQILRPGQTKLDWNVGLGSINCLKHLRTAIRLRPLYPFVSLWFQLCLSPLKAGAALRYMFNCCTQLGVYWDRIDFDVLVQRKTYRGLLALICVPESPDYNSRSGAWMVDFRGLSVEQLLVFAGSHVRPNVM